ncbi:MAG: ribokinase [Acidimicrobiales bacterium]
MTVLGTTTALANGEVAASGDGTGVLVVGAYNAALTISGGRIPRPGETVLAARAVWEPGGKAANQAVAIARFGVACALVCRVGDDELGRQAVEVLASEGLPTEGLLVSTGRTGLAVVCVDSSGENSISVVQGVNAELSVDDVDRVLASLRLAAPVGYVVGQLECGAELALALARYTRARGLRFVLNPAPALRLDPRVYDAVDLLTPNEHELATLTRDAGLPEDASEEVRARALLALGVGEVVVTLGAAGALWVSRERAVRVRAPHVEAVDTTGAGDAFTGALVASLVAGQTMRCAVERACRAGAFSVTKAGVFAGLGREMDTLPTVTPGTPTSWR